MPMKQANYQKVRGRMRTGDIVAFGGRGFVSWLTKRLTGSNVSHVGIVVQTHLRDTEQKNFDNLIVESTKRGNCFGVLMAPCRYVVDQYEGEVWWLPLRREVRDRFKQDALANFLYRDPDAIPERSTFDWWGALIAMVDSFGKLTHNPEEFDKYFCSELIARGLECAGAVPNVNASEVSPIDVCQWAVYKKNYFQLRGDLKGIDAYNTVQPEDWQPNRTKASRLLKAIRQTRRPHAKPPPSESREQPDAQPQPPFTTPPRPERRRPRPQPPATNSRQAPASTS